MISGEKVVIKGMTKSGAEKMYHWVNQEHLRPFTGTLYPISEYEHEEWIHRQVTSADRKLFLVCDKASQKEIGIIGLKNFDYTHRHVELFVSIGEKEYLKEKNEGENSQGGYGSDAVRTLVHYCFRQLNFHKVYLHVFASNQRAIRSYEKCGFVCEGELRDHHFQDGKYETVYIMGILAPLQDAEN